MDIKLFSDVIDALGKVAAAFESIAKLPRKERDRFRQTFSETYRLIDTTMNMVIIRLGDILLLKDDNEFIDEVAKLDNYDDWLRAEREFRLCQSLRAALRETENLPKKIIGKIATKDWDTLLDNMREVLGVEADVAYHIGSNFRELADSARNLGPEPEFPAGTREKVRALRAGLIEERNRLIEQEIELSRIV